jgi:hypothetical protein
MNGQKLESEPQGCGGENNGTTYVEEKTETVAAWLHLRDGREIMARTIRLYTDRERGRHRVFLVEVEALIFIPL